ncbi:redoxin domain-containing protein [Aggregicoccus sp. 17bor-14]|uniref:peroxiredoxin family protein n=1 Tax=Myxococcaceae TaxID=31 RepID=UPI00129C82F0|nr:MULTISPECIES: redoxin domain-containing protein [Myxococcaceae]MBF5043527.1 redoxin domain-containing protein [Simulacricoccus sp. 17bor-14]MRI89284.1 redoxin domain-containing protein [Aggregicoccus sp. 17bor-14]
MLAPGTLAPRFRVFSTHGTRVSLADFRGQRLVLCFFPRAFGAAGLRETRALRDSAVALEAAGVALLGVSADTYSRACDFARAERLAFPLVADPEGHVCRDYGARSSLWPLTHSARALTYVLDEAGRVERAFPGAAGAEAALAFLKLPREVQPVRSLRALPSPAPLAVLEPTATAAAALLRRAVSGAVSGNAGSASSGAALRPALRVVRPV